MLIYIPTLRGTSKAADTIFNNDQRPLFLLSFIAGSRTKESAPNDRRVIQTQNKIIGLFHPRLKVAPYVISKYERKLENQVLIK